MSSTYPLHLGTTADGKPFRLPLAMVTQTVAILARKGRGKTYTAAVFAEELLAAGQLPIIIDITGAHWGLKASADGKAEGFPVVVFGGDHADIPLEEHAGESVARAIVEQRFPAIIDTSLLRKGATARFLAVFFETLYRLNREAVHIIADEADAYAPQKPGPEEARVLGAMQDIVRRGRIKGIGCTMITQRPQVLNKDVLTQADMLVALGMTHPRDISAIEEWVAVHGDMKQAQRMIASLPSLEVGTAWFWAPALNDIFEVVKIRARRTFDSSATPKPGERIAAPKKLAEIDVAKLGAEIQASLERAKENDPAELKRKIAELQRQLAAKPAAAPAQISHVPVISDYDRSLLESAKALLVESKAALDAVGVKVEAMTGHLHQATLNINSEIKRFAGRGGAAPKEGAPNRADTGQAPQRTVTPRPDARDARSPTASAGSSALSKAEKRILTCLAQHGQCERGKLALLSGYSYSGGFRNSLSALRSAGYIEGGNEEMMRITESGTSALGSYDPLPTGEDLGHYWLNNPAFGTAERAILKALLLTGAGYSGPDLAKACGYEFSGGFRNALSALRTAGVIIGKNQETIRANSNLLFA